RRAVALALGIMLLTYLLVAAALMVGLGTDRLATEATPLVTVVDAGEASALGVLVRAGAAVAAGSALLSVLVGVSRTALAMARRAGGPRAARAAPGGAPTSRAASSRSASRCWPGRLRRSRSRPAACWSTTP